MLIVDPLTSITLLLIPIAVATLFLSCPNLTFLFCLRYVSSARAEMVKFPDSLSLELLTPIAVGALWLALVLNVSDLKEVVDMARQK